MICSNRFHSYKTTIRRILTTTEHISQSVVISQVFALPQKRILYSATKGDETVLFQRKGAKGGGFKKRKP